MRDRCWTIADHHRRQAVAARRWVRREQRGSAFRVQMRTLRRSLAGNSLRPRDLGGYDSPR